MRQVGVHRAANDRMREAKGLFLGKDLRLTERTRERSGLRDARERGGMAQLTAVAKDRHRSRRGRSPRPQPRDAIEDMPCDRRRPHFGDPLHVVV